MQLAILFWFYKEPEICKNHLQILRQHNPTLPIYGLYGGDLAAVDQYTSLLDDYLDDLYIFTQDKSSDWKWHLGDLLITDWYTMRGQHLPWDTIVIVQWDMLVFGSIQDVFSPLQKDQILLSGLRPIREIEERWSWTSTTIQPELRAQYLAFLDHVKDKYGYDQDPLCCLFIVVCFPREFLDQYSKIPEPELGFLEYKVPIYAQIFGTPFCTNHRFNPWWAGDPKTASNRKTLNAKRLDVGLFTIFENLFNPKGVRVFHPYRKKFPISLKQWSWVLQILVQEKKEWMLDVAKQLRYGIKP